SRILIIGLAYKPDVDDMRESPTFTLMDSLRNKGAEVSYFDQFIPEITPTRDHGNWTGVSSVEWTQEVISSVDCVIISTAHSDTKFAELAEWASCIVDTRNAMKQVSTANSVLIKA